jgi:hypothetical protein
VIVAAPDQVPVVELSVDASRAVPVIAGSTPLTGGAGGPITAVAAEVAVPVPAALSAVTFSRTVEPTSAGPSTYVAPLATAAQLEPSPSQRRHS